MAFNWDLLVPYKYGNRYISLRELHAEMSRGYHPEYVRRFIGWLHYKNGTVGAGGLARTEQPDKPGFAPSLEQSFHWSGQRYNDGLTGACAVDTVYKDGPDPGDAHDGIAWREVPIQGSAEAVRWGIHANVGVPGNGESWHLQPIEVDGHGSWVSAGRPAPRAGYPIPAEHNPAAVQPDPPPPSTEDPNVFKALIRLAGTAHVYAQYTGGYKVWVRDGNVLNAYRFVHSAEVQDIPATARALFEASGPIVGDRPAGVDAFGIPV